MKMLCDVCGNSLTILTKLDGTRVPIHAEPSMCFGPTDKVKVD